MLPVEWLSADNFDAAITSVGHLIEVMFVFYAVIKHPYRTDFNDTLYTTDMVEFIKQGLELPVVKTIIAVEYLATAEQAIAVTGFSHWLTRRSALGMVAMFM